MPSPTSDPEVVASNGSLADEEGRTPSQPIPSERIIPPATEASAARPALDAAVPPTLSGQLSGEAQAVLDDLMDGRKDEVRRAALAKLPTLPPDDKHNLAATILGYLPEEENEWKRTWMVSALGALNVPGTFNTVATRLDPAQESSEWVRYWAAIAVAQMQPSNLRDWLEYVRHDPDLLVKAVALRLLIESGAEDHVEALVYMANDADWYARWAACKVLRRQAGTKSFREAVEGRFIHALENCLLDKRLVVDVRFQAALALGDLQYKKLDAIKALSRVLEDDVPDWVRRTCVDALDQINRPETKAALLVALRDTDAEIRFRAANALKRALGPEEAVGCIVHDLLRQDQLPLEYLDALRRVDQKAASRIISENVLHPDIKVAERARTILVQLGGEDAVRALQKQREEAINAYTELLKDADDQTMGQFEGLMKQARSAFAMTMGMHALIFTIGVGVLIVSLRAALAQGFDTFERFIGVGGAVGSVSMLLTLFYRDPLKNIRESVSNLLKVNVVFTGYMRQINQIDAAFKQLFLSLGGYGTAEMKQTVEQIQGSVKGTMGEVKQYLD